MYKKRAVYKRFEAWPCIVGSLIVAFAFVTLCRGIAPDICEMAASAFQSDFNKICNNAVIECVEEGPKAEDFIIIDRDEKGEIKGIRTNTMEINRLKSKISLKIQEELDKIKEINVEYPFNGIFGINSGFMDGFEIPVQLIGAGLMETDIVSSFDSVGVNQTRLTINAVIQMEGKLLALGDGAEIEIKSNVPVLMTVIVGNVPNTYVDVKK
ncbi:MAG: hypothetical protein IJE44_00370 [Clostridia bacterium]|nr:hypothetical protein [Clostridia bacterium]